MIFAAFQYGFAFGCLSFGALVTGPFTGQLCARFGAATAIIAGTLAQITCGYLFGLLHFTQNLYIFLGVSYILRLVEGCAAALAWTAALSLVTTNFPENVSKLVSMTEVSMAVGGMLGPAFGSILYNWKGFPAPFWIISSISALNVLAVAFGIPDSSHSQSDMLNPLELLKKPKVLIPILDHFICYLGNGLIDPMLGQYMNEKINSSASTVGWVFATRGLIFLLASFLSGYVCLQNFERPFFYIKL